MPRTKAPKNARKETEDGIDKKALLAIFLKRRKELEEEIANFKTKVTEVLEEHLTDLLRKIPEDILNKTLGELKNLSSISLNSTSLIDVTNKGFLSVLNQTKTAKKSKKLVTRSSSFDEGYLTTESSTSVTRTSSTRGRSKVTKPAIEKRKTRSLSRNVENTSKNASLKTPVNNKKPNSYGIVTPKCKPNTPHVLLRRPKKGEVALSFQGSPLLTAPVCNEEVANVNIPLNDGTLLSLQPQKGLRLSQIPAFDSETLKQLETLNQHIQMMLKASGNSDI